MKFKEVWYLDSSKQYLAWNFTNFKSVVDWTISCRFCSQKINLLVFLTVIADHARPLVHVHRIEWRKQRKKAATTLKHKPNLDLRPRFSYGLFLPIWYCINLSFWYLNAVCSAAMAVLFVWIPCGTQYVNTTRWHTWHQEGWCK
jgi:hypothetical protein